MRHCRSDYNRIQDPLYKIPADEPVFLFRAQDRSAAKYVRMWAREQHHLVDGDHELADMAERWADEMDKWPKKKTADL